MMSVQKIERLVERGQTEALLEAVVQNGRPLPLGVRLRLGESVASVRAAGLGLALQRVVELSYGPDPAALRIAERLLDQLCEVDGLEGPDRPSPASLVVALAGLEDLLAQLERFGHPAEGFVGEGLVHASAAVAHVLLEAAALSNADPATRGLVGEAVDSAVVLWQLAGRARLADRLRPGVELSQLQRAAVRHALWKQPHCGPVLALAAAEGLAVVGAAPAIAA
jgi:hypothetical protein